MIPDFVYCILYVSLIFNVYIGVFVYLISKMINKKQETIEELESELSRIQTFHTKIESIRVNGVTYKVEMDFEVEE